MFMHHCEIQQLELNTREDMQHTSEFLLKPVIDVIFHALRLKIAHIFVHVFKGVFGSNSGIDVQCIMVNL